MRFTFKITASYNLVIIGSIIKQKYNGIQSLSLNNSKLLQFYPRISRLIIHSYQTKLIYSKTIGSKFFPILSHHVQSIIDKIFIHHIRSHCVGFKCANYSNRVLGLNTVLQCNISSCKLLIFRWLLLVSHISSLTHIYA